MAKQKPTLTTTIQTRAYPRNADGYAKLEECFATFREVYNSALAERRRGYKEGRSITYFDQCKSLTKMRNRYGDVESMSVNILRGALTRVRDAMKGFYSRVEARKEGRSKLKPGYPRIKKNRFRTITVVDIGKGQFSYNPKTGHGSIDIKGLPRLRFKDRRIPEGSHPSVIHITLKPNGVYLSMVFNLGEPPPAPEEGKDRPSNPVGIDVGVNKRGMLSSGEWIERRERDDGKAKRLQRKMNRLAERAVKEGRAKKVGRGIRWNKGRPSRGYRKAQAQRRRLLHRETVRDRNEMHQAATAIVRAHDAIAVEGLQVSNMMRSAKGTVENPGRNVAQKTGLNRSISEQAWSIFFFMLEYKAERAGTRFLKVDPKYTSQTCSRCGTVDGESRKDERFRCVHCGFTDDADHNAAVNVLLRGMSKWGFQDAGDEIAGRVARLIPASARYPLGVSSRNVRRIPQRGRSTVGGHTPKRLTRKRGRPRLRKQTPPFEEDSQRSLWNFGGEDADESAP